MPPVSVGSTASVAKPQAHDKRRKTQSKVRVVAVQSGGPSRARMVWTHVWAPANPACSWRSVSRTASPPARLDAARNPELRRSPSLRLMTLISGNPHAQRVRNATSPLPGSRRAATGSHSGRRSGACGTRCHACPSTTARCRDPEDLRSSIDATTRRLSPSPGASPWWTSSDSPRPVSILTPNCPCA